MLDFFLVLLNKSPNVISRQYSLQDPILKGSLYVRSE